MNYVRRETKSNSTLFDIKFNTYEQLQRVDYGEKPPSGLVPVLNGKRSLV